MKFGYARVLPNDQDLDIQLEELNRYGVDKIYIEKITDTSTDRPKLRKIRQQLKKGDTIVVYSLDKLGVNIKQLIYLTEGLYKKGIYLVSIKEKIIPYTEKGDYTFQLFDDLVQMEGSIISEKTKEGMEKAKSKGKPTGRPPVKKEKIKKIKDMYYTDHAPIKDIVKKTGLAKSTIYKYLRIEQFGKNEK